MAGSWLSSWRGVSPVADTWLEPDRRAYQSWHARLGVEAFCKISCVLVPLRLAQVWFVGFSEKPWQVFAGVFFMVVVRAAACMSYARQTRGKPAAVALFDMPAEKGVAAVALAHEWRFWIAVQFGVWLALLSSFGILCLLVDITVMNRFFLGGFLPGILIQCFLMYLPKRLYLGMVLPTNCCAAFLYYHSRIAQWDTATLSLAIGCVTVCVYAYVFKDQTAGGLFRTKLASERLWRVAESERQRADAWRGTLKDMLDSTFDASCTCDAGGMVETSTPHLDLMLLGSGGNAEIGGPSLQGCGLPSFAADEVEQKRMASFLADLVKCSGMRKMQFSLSRASTIGSSYSVEVIVSGIVLPETAVSDSIARLFLGFQITGGLEPMEMPESYSWDAAGMLPRLLEGAGETFVASAGRAVSGFDIDLASSIGEDAPQAQRAPSCFSAPPVIVHPRASRHKPCDGKDGDCLPPDAVVWIEGQSVPAKVADVGSGSRVLCYDHLSGGLKYSEVVDVATHDASTSDWVVVKLEDGTELKMTADHPVYPQAPGLVGERSGIPVKAGDLQASAHSLEVLRLVAIPVREVQVISRTSGGEEGGGAGGSLAPSERVSLSVRQPERHSVFVSSGPSGKGSMAVASASVNVEGATNQRQVKNTFIEGLEDQEITAPAPHRLRARSMPATACRRSCLTDHSQRSSVLLHKVVAAASSRASTMSYASSVMSSIWQPGDSSPRFVLGADRPVERSALGRVAERELVEAASLSQALEVRKQELPSIGSLAHAAGQCCPCLIETMHQTGTGFAHAPCRSGLLCGRCHEPHDKKDLTAMRYERRRAARKVARRGVRCTE